MHALAQFAILAADARSVRATPRCDSKPISKLIELAKRTRFEHALAKLSKRTHAAGGARLAALTTSHHSNVKPDLQPARGPRKTNNANPIMRKPNEPSRATTRASSASYL